MVVNRHQGWLVDVVVGGLAGGLVAGVGVLNLFIYTGIDDGYEAGLSDAFAQNVVVGLLAVCLLATGPIAGVFIARRRRRRSGTSTSQLY